MGTMVEITLLSSQEEEARKAALQAFQEIKRIEQLMSPKIASGDVFRINQSAGTEWVKVSPETMEVIHKAKEISDSFGRRLRYHRSPPHPDLEDSQRKRGSAFGG